MTEDCIPKATASEEFTRHVQESDHPWKDWVTFEIEQKKVRSLLNKTLHLAHPHLYRELLRKLCVE